MGTLIDTSLLVKLERRASALGRAFGPLFASLLQDALGPDEEVAIAAITASELLHGVHRASTDHRARREAFVEAIISAIPVVPFDLRVARVHARIWAELAASGTDVGAHDRLVGATAMTLGWRVVTGNARHFSPIAGLVVIDAGDED